MEGGIMITDIFGDMCACALSIHVLWPFSYQELLRGEFTEGKPRNTPFGLLPTLSYQEIYT